MLLLNDIIDYDAQVPILGVAMFTDAKYQVLLECKKCIIQAQPRGHQFQNFVYRFWNL